MTTWKEAERKSEIENLKDAIADICERMKGPLSALDRALLHADRKEMRERLTQLTGK